MAWERIKAFAEARGWRVTSTVRGRGTNVYVSPHSLGIAVDVSVKGKTTEQIAAFIADALKNGFRVVDERRQRGISKDWTGAHIHLEDNPASKKPSSFDSVLGYGSVALETLKNIDLARIGGKISESVSGSTTNESTVAENYKVYELSAEQAKTATSGIPANWRGLIVLVIATIVFIQVFFRKAF